MDGGEVSDKPLHVRVAEALGWTELALFEAYGIVDPKCWVGEPPQPGSGFVPDYDTDWSATGPLIERLEVSIVAPDKFNPEFGEHRYLAGTGGAHGWDDGSICLDHEAGGETPLIAVCNLILALKEAGKL